MPTTQQLRDLIAASDHWLTARIIHYAKERGYTPFTSTLEQAWLASIRGLSTALLAALDLGRLSSPVEASSDYTHDPIALFGIEAARRHRTRGVTLGLFLGLMKSYRETYQDLVSDPEASPQEREANRRSIDRFFDRMEVGFCDEWSGRPADEQFEQLRTQNRLITNEKNKYLTIFESLNDPVILVDEKGNVDNANHAALTRFAGEAAPGASYYSGAHLPIEDILGAEALAETEIAFERLLPTNLGPRWFEVRVQRMLDVSEKYQGAVVILNDVTEYRRAREEAERADRAKSAFLATISHEIRTPIHGILGLAELLGQGALSSDSRRYVEAIARSGQMLSSVVSDILDYSKIEAGALELDETEFSVSSVIEDVFGLLLPLAARKLDLQLVLDAPALPGVVGDSGKLRQILLNLVGNAVKFTERGEVRLIVSARDDGADRVWLSFEVLDTGIGVAPDRLEAIFDPFMQSDASVARRFGGSGLGLAICRRLVDRLGGEIWARSRLGEGSRFGFAAPFARTATNRPARRAEMSADLVGMPLSLDVLVVEDNEVNAMVACGLLERAGHRATLASTGEAAVEQVRSRDFDVVLMDLRLPDIDGAEATRRIRSLDSGKKSRVPVVAVSAQVVASDIDACTRAGVNAFLGKPFRMDRLEATLRRVVIRHARRYGAKPRKFRKRDDAPAPDPQKGLIDETALAEHVKLLGLEQTRRIVSAFEASVANAPEDIERLTTAGEHDKLAGIAHRLRSSSLHVGLLQLSDRAATVERLAKTEDDDLAPVANELAADCRRGLAALRQVFARISAAQPANT
ncbi:hybrid sensor histidine kinase/response regulator [Roseiarcus fermentans]|nr:ATP-binding protein [Roseiarcus fermentans]